mgnify:CR=1 FL=1
MQLSELQNHLDALREASRLRDYCPNGLQVEGRPEVRRVLCGVTASQPLLDLAVAEGYDAILVHHGYFWRGEDGRITGVRKRRLATLLNHDISLLAYHLPLDVHPELGNNAQLGKLMGWVGEGRFADQDLGWIGRPTATPEPERAAQVARSLAARLGREPLLVGKEQRLEALDGGIIETHRGFEPAPQVLCPGAASRHLEIPAHERHESARPLAGQRQIGRRPALPRHEPVANHVGDDGDALQPGRSRAIAENGGTLRHRPGPRGRVILRRFGHQRLEHRDRGRLERGERFPPILR